MTRASGAVSGPREEDSRRCPHRGQRSADVFRTTESLRAYGAFMPERVLSSCRRALRGVRQMRTKDLNF